MRTTRFTRVARTAIYVLAVVAIVAYLTTPAHGFTQSGLATALGDGIPMGHEWVTRLAALEVIGGDPLPRDPNDPRNQWKPEGRAKNTDVSSPGAQAEIARIRSMTTNENRYLSVYSPVFDAILGERWVDIGGFNVAKAKIGKIDCWDVVAQEAVEIQYDHFMRRYDDNGAAGGVEAARRSQERFVDYFVAAAMAPPTRMRVWDGGGYSAQADVDRNYFLFGRAVHLFEDSFSSEHTVRLVDDSFQRVRQVKAYLCSTGAEQHSHKTPTAADFSSGDVIWIQGTELTRGWKSYKPSFMKPHALSATEATKDLWAAFIRTMGTPMGQRRAVARKEAETLVTNWLSFDPAEMLAWYDDEAHRDATYVLAAGQSGKGVSVPTCMDTIDKKWKGDQKAAVDNFAEGRRVCLYNIQPLTGYSDLYDTAMFMPYNWEWINKVKWLTPPAGWQPPAREADTGTRVQIRSVATGQSLSAPGGLKDRSAIKATAGPPLDLILVGSPSDGFLRATLAPTLFFSYNRTPGDAMLWNGTKDSSYRLAPAGPGHSIYSPAWKDYFWLNGDTPRLNRKGDPRKADAQWMIDGL